MNMINIADTYQRYFINYSFQRNIEIAWWGFDSRKQLDLAIKKLKQDDKWYLRRQPLGEIIVLNSKVKPFEEIETDLVRLLTDLGTILFICNEYDTDKCYCVLNQERTKFIAIAENDTVNDFLKNDILDIRMCYLLFINSKIGYFRKHATQQYKGMWVKCFKKLVKREPDCIDIVVYILELADMPELVKEISRIPKLISILD